jgi:hypothetical protein
VFPAEGQEADQPSKAEAACYEWAVDDSGNDPFELQKQSQTAQQLEIRHEMENFKKAFSVCLEAKDYLVK